MGLGNRPDASFSSRPAVMEVMTDEFAQRFPVLCEWLYTDRWDDGTPRVLPSINLFVELGAFKCFLNDRDLSRSACLTGATVGQLFATCERRLAAGDLEWRPSKPARKR